MRGMVALLLLIPTLAVAAAVRVRVVALGDAETCRSDRALASQLRTISGVSVVDGAFDFDAALEREGADWRISLRKPDGSVALRRSLVGAKECADVSFAAALIVERFVRTLDVQVDVKGGARARPTTSLGMNGGSPGDAKVPEAADSKAADSKAADSKAADSKAADSKAADSKAADSKTSGSTTSGSTTAGSTTAGSKTAGSKTAGTRAAETKAAETKAADAKAAQTKAAQTKAAEAKAAEAKAAETKAAETKAAQTKAAEAKGAETKAAETKAAETKAAETKAAEAKAAEAKAAEAKAAEAKAAQTKAAEAKAAETKAAETKAAETKAAETKAAETKAAQAKAAETKAAEAKASPAATSPAATSPAATSPAATSPAATSPAATSPAATSPAAANPATTSPGATNPATTITATTASGGLTPTATEISAPAPTPSSLRLTRWEVSASGAGWFTNTSAPRLGFEANAATFIANNWRVAAQFAFTSTEATSMLDADQKVRGTLITQPFLAALNLAYCRDELTPAHLRLCGGLVGGAHMESGYTTGEHLFHSRSAWLVRPAFGLEAQLGWLPIRAFVVSLSATGLFVTEGGAWEVVGWLENRPLPLFEGLLRLTIAFGADR